VIVYESVREKVCVCERESKREENERRERERGNKERP
jgi:hypothetical protein